MKSKYIYKKYEDGAYYLLVQTVECRISFFNLMDTSHVANFYDIDIMAPASFTLYLSVAGDICTYHSVDILKCYRIYNCKYMIRDILPDTIVSANL